jgi:hypothetical protein
MGRQDIAAALQMCVQEYAREAISAHLQSENPSRTARDAAIKTLQDLGYTYHDGEQWKPPLGKPQAEPVAADRLHIGACITDGKLHATVMRREPNGYVTVLATAEMDAASLHDRDCLTQMLAARPPVAQQGAAEPVAWRTKFDELLEDYAMARVETALFNAKVIQRGRLARPRLEALQQHVAAQPVAQGLTEAQVEAAWRMGFRAAIDAERLNADEEWGYKAAEVIEKVAALCTTHPAQADEGPTKASADEGGV